MIRLVLSVIGLSCLAGAAAAHTSEGSFVLLLPTGVYRAAGVAVVALTVVAVFALPHRLVRALFGWRALRGLRTEAVSEIASLTSFALMVFAIWIGITGSRDPLSNILPLSFYTLGWIGLVSLSGLLGDVWGWLNPWTGLYRIAGSPRPLLRLPDGLGLWPAVLMMVGFGAYILAGVAPEDPDRLAWIVAVYWAAIMAGLVVFGPAFLASFELGHAIMGSYGRLAALRIGAPGGIGGPGWRILEGMPRAGGLFALTLLAVGSFDGLNETFWWLGRIGVNPLEFPGRSAVIFETLAGLVASVLGLWAIFAATVWLGLALAGRGGGFARAFDRLALGVLPIALVYHAAHYLTAFLVNIQYTVAAISDPFNRGDDLLGIEPFHVTTGFFNNIDSVRAIWLTQAVLIVGGHVWSVLLSHRLALDLAPEGQGAARLTLPLSVFMIAYTFLGLWLLAAPRGA